jgi:hypothetical protein
MLNTEIDSCMDMLLKLKIINNTNDLFLLKINDIDSNTGLDLTISQVFFKSTIVRSPLYYDSYYTHNGGVFLMLNFDGHNSLSPKIDCLKSRKDSTLIFNYVFNDFDSNKWNLNFSPAIDAHFTITSKAGERRIYSQINQVPIEKAAILYLRELE